MDQSLVVLDYSFWWLLPAVLLAMAFSVLSYFRVDYPWSKYLSLLMGTLRFFAVLLLLILLLNPLVRQLQNQEEQPVVAVLYDNSESVKMGTDSLTLQGLQQSLIALRDELAAEAVAMEFYTLEGLGDMNQEDLAHDQKESNLSRSLQRVVEGLSGKNLSSMVLLTDGIYNRGVSPSYLNYPRPVFTVGLGDTIPSKDVSIKQVKNNAVAYQGNSFPVEVILDQEGYTGVTKEITLSRRGVELATQTITDERKVNFEVATSEAGLGRYTVRVAAQSGENSYDNNFQDFYVDVIEGKEKILIVARGPHPDISAIRQALSGSENFETELFIPGVSKRLPAGEYDVVIEHNAFSQNFPVIDIKGDPSRWYILGPQSRTPLAAEKTGLLINRKGNQRDLVKASFNPAFSSFELNRDEIEIFTKYPPISVPFGDYSASGPMQTLIYQQIGSVVTGRPLLAVFDDGATKGAILVGQGLWQWRLLEGIENENSNNFDEIVNKLIQYLSVKADKRKFRFLPESSSFRANDEVVFRAELYNDIYESVYNNKIDVTLTDEQGSTQAFEYYQNEGDAGFSVGTLESGVYSFTARTNYGNKTHESSGEFLVRVINLESTDLTADHEVLKEVSKKTGGKYVSAENFNEVPQAIKALNPRGVIRTSESFFPLLSAWWFLLLAILLFSCEWLLRKYFGSY